MKIPIKFLRPVLVREGESLPFGYSVCRYVPMLFSFNDGMEMYRWEKIALPIPISLLASMWYRVEYFIFRGMVVPREMYTNRTFIVLTHCPHCKASLREEPELAAFGGVLSRIGEKIHSGIELDRNERKL